MSEDVCVWRGEGGGRVGGEVGGDTESQAE